MSFTVIEGNGDVVRIIEDLLAQAKAGQLEALIFATLTSHDDNAGQVGSVYREGTSYAFARMVNASREIIWHLKRRGDSI